MQQVRAFEMSEVSLRKAALISRACAPTGGIANLSFEFLFGDERRDGVEDDDVEGVGANKRFDDAERFFAGARLRDQEVVEIDAQLAGILRVERVLDVDEGSQAAALLRLSDDREGESRFAGGFRAEDLHNPPPRHTADAEGAVDQNVPGGDDVDIDNFFVAQAHDGAFAVVFGDLLDREIEILVTGGDNFVFGGFFFSLGGHSGPLR